MTWEKLAQLCAQTPLPVLAKGILHPQDAEAALAAGVRGLIVSNHGGRTLDSALPAITALPGVAAAVAGRAPVLLDSGIRRGTDVLKALALGADAVLLGRPLAAALAVGGTRGAAQAIRLLLDELAVAMALCGCPTLASLCPDLLHPRQESCGLDRSYC